MENDFSIRIGTPADARAIAEIHVAGWRTAYEGIVPGELLASLSIERREDMWRRGFDQRRPGRGIFVAEREGVVIGFADCGPSMDADADAGTGEVYTIYVRPDVIGSGVGRALFARATDHLREHGFRRATLWVLPENARTRRFYEIARWRPDGTEKTEDWGGFPLREIRYETEL